jgi:hypothetical protein
VVLQFAMVRFATERDIGVQHCCFNSINRHKADCLSLTLSSLKC